MYNAMKLCQYYWLLFVVILMVGCDKKDEYILSGSADTILKLPTRMIDGDGNVICDRDFGDPQQSFFILPYLQGNSAYLIQAYCHEPNSHHDRFAIDFGLGFKDTIIAARTGIIRSFVEYYDDFDYTYGHHNYITVVHFDGTRGFYAHLAQSSVMHEIGDTVRQGEGLALNGTSGMPFYFPCLHFEIHYDTLVIDRSNSVPVNFRNANGPLNSNNGVLDSGSVYTAQDFIPNDL